jgi:hypothetical protein
VQSYRKFAALDLDHFDLVLSTKYPAVDGPARQSYRLPAAPLRGLYDTYPAVLPTALPALPRPIAGLAPLLERDDLDRSALPELFGLLDTLASDRAIGPTTSGRSSPRFRGPLRGPSCMRSIAWGLPQARCAGISRSRGRCASAKATFRRARMVTVVPHPSDVEAFRDGAGEFVFTASRLEAASASTSW